MRPDEHPALPATPGEGGARLPAVAEDAGLAEVLDGEVVETPAPSRPVYVLNVVKVFQTVNIVVQAPPARLAARHGSLVAIGAVVALRRWHRHRTRHRRMAAAAEAAGDHETSLKWTQQAEAERHRRHERRVAVVEAVVLLARAAPWIAGAAFGAMVALGFLLAMAQRRLEAVAIPFETAGRLAQDAVAVAPDVALALAIAAPAAAVVALHRLGGHAGDLAPAWLQTAADADVDMAIDEAAITRALGQLRIPQITEYLKLGQPMPYIVPCRQEGRGTYAEIRLPGGLPAGEIAKAARRERLAAGLYRHTKEVWPTVGADNSHLKLWIADKGALSDGAGPYPLLGDGAVDVFKGVPFGRTLRGDELLAPLMERNTIAGGMPGQGKSSAARVIVCGAALDPTAELWIMIPDINFDFELMKRRCSRYVMGAEDEHVATIRDWLSDLRDEVQARGQLLVDHEIPSVTRRLASAGIGLHPLVVLLEEAHVAIQHAEYGKEIAGLLTDVVKLGRKRGIHVIVSTQAPTKDSMPRDVTRNCSNGIAFAVGDHVPNDALLGAGAYRAGHRATELIPGTDRGIAVVKGFSGERSEMVQVYFISVDDPDQVTPIIDRSLAEIARRGRGLPGGSAPELAIQVPRDLLEDLDEVIDGPDRVRLSELPPLLRKLDKAWLPYRALDGVQLAELLDREGVKWVKTGNKPQLDPAELARAIAERRVS
jgi:S-DNA-T family DNA segregation ATPase FtsK/SpoIIIE